MTLRVAGVAGLCGLSGTAVWLLWHAPGSALGIWLWCLLAVAMPLPWLHRPRSWTWWSLAIPTALFVLALAPRLYGNDLLPLGLHGDEAHHVLIAEALLQNGLVNAFGDQAWGVPAPGFFWLMFWVGLSGPTLTAGRVASAVAGALTVVLVYLLGRTIGGLWLGLLAAGLLLVAHTHLMLSHLGTVNAQAPLLTTLTVWLLLISWRRSSGLAASLAAVSFVLTCLNWPGARLIIPVVGLGILATLLWRGQRPSWPPVLVFVVGCGLLLAAPVAYYARVDNGWSLAVARLDTSILHPVGWRHVTGTLPLPTLIGVVEQQVRGTLSAFLPVSTGDASTFYTFARPLIDPATLAVAILGLGLLVARPKQLHPWLLPLLVIPLTLISASLIVDSPNYHWLALMLPAMMLLGGHALNWLRLRLQHGRGVVAAVLLAISLLNGQWFFVDYPREGAGPFLMTSLASLADEYQVSVYVLTPDFPFHHESIRLLDRQRRIQPPPAPIYSADPDAVWVAQSTDDVARLETLERWLPSHTRRDFRDNRGTVIIQALVPTNDHPR